MKQMKGKITWLDFLNPSETEIEKLQKEYRLHDVIAEELGGPSARARAEVIDDYIYLVYYFPAYNERTKTSKLTK